MTQQQQQTAAEMRLLLSMADKPPSFDESQALQEAGSPIADQDTPRCDWATQDLFTGIVNAVRSETANADGATSRLAHVYHTARRLFAHCQRSVPERITVTTADTEHAASTRPTRYTLWPEVVPTDLPADLRARADTFQSMMDTLPRLSTKRAHAGHALLDSVALSFDSKDDFGGISQDVVRKTLAPLADGLDLAECLHLAEHASTHETTPEMMEVFAHHPGSLLSFCLSSGPTRDALASDAEAQESWKKEQQRAGRDTLQQRPTSYSSLSQTLREIQDQVEPCMRVSPREEKSYLHALKKERQTLNWLATRLTTLDKEMSLFVKADESARRIRRTSRLLRSDGSREGPSQETTDS
jgi:hypothetical protein